MLVRTGMLSFESISELTITVMKRYWYWYCISLLPFEETILKPVLFFFKSSYKWSRSILFYDANGQRSVAGEHTCYLMMTSLGKQMRSENMTFAQYRTSGNVTNRTEEMAREIGNKNTGKCNDICTYMRVFRINCLKLLLKSMLTDNC